MTRGRISVINYILGGTIEPEFSMNLESVDYDAILEDELTSNVDDDSDVFGDNPDIPENLLEAHPIRYAYLFNITGESKQRILKGKYHFTVDLLFDWFGLVCFADKNKNCK